MTDQFDAKNQASSKQSSVKAFQPNSPKPRWLLRLLLALFLVLFLIVLTLFFVAGSERGTRFILDKVSQRDDIDLKYTKGTLKDGVWIEDLLFSTNEDISIQADVAYVELGWKSLFHRRVHLVNPTIDRLTVHNNKPSTDEPFDFTTIKLPIQLELDNPNIKEFIYTQVGSEDVVLTGMTAKNIFWEDTQLNAKQVYLIYSDVLDVSNATGFIRFDGEYPLQLTAQVHIHDLDELYISAMRIDAGGTLKRTTGKMYGQYNQSAVEGDFIVQGLDDDTPFFARLNFDEVLLPYAQSQEIRLTNGTIIADGVISKIGLRMNTHLSAKDIPDGQYQARATVDKNGMKVPFLQAQTKQGLLNATGQMSWHDAFELDATLSAKNYLIRQAIPQEYQEYRDYLPNTLNGKLDFRYFVKDDQGNERYELHLRQDDTEDLAVHITQAQNPNAPWQIKASWLNLHRNQLPQIGKLHSSQGEALVVVHDDKTDINLDASIEQFGSAPAGQYRLMTQIHQDERIDLQDFHYQGVVGDIQGDGQILLATQQRPLSWKINLNAQKILPNAYFASSEKTPLEQISGQAIIAGRLRQDDGKDIYDVIIEQSDLLAKVNDGQQTQQLNLQGSGLGYVGLKNNEIYDLKVQFAGEAEQSFLPIGKSKISVDVQGDLKSLALNQIKLEADAGKVAAQGKLNLNDGIAWDLQTQVEQLSTAQLTSNPSLLAVISGDMTTQGSWQDGQLQRVYANIDADIHNNKHLSTGKIQAKLFGSNNRFEIEHLSHVGEMGNLQATGWVDISQGIRWQAKANMDQLNLNGFVQGINSQIHGKISTYGDWQQQKQIVALPKIDLTGNINGQPLQASGSLYADINLPNDMKGYIDRIKQATHRPNSKDELLSLRQRIDNNARQTQQIVQNLKADNLQISFGNNFVKMHGTDERLTTNINITNLNQIYNKARGSIKGGVILINDDNALPTLYIDMSVAQLRAPNILVQNATAIGKIVNLGNSNSQLLAQGNDIIVLGRVIKALRLDFSGTEANHLLSFASESSELKTAATIQGELNRKTMQYQGVLSGTNVAGSFGLLLQRQPTQFRYNLSDNRVEVAPHCWQNDHSQVDGQGVLCLQDKMVLSKDDGSVNLVIQNLNTQVFSAILPSEIQWQSMLNGRAKVSWQKDKDPMVDAEIYSKNGRIGLVQEETGYVEMPYKYGSVIAQSVEKGLKIRTDIEGVAGKGYADIIINPFVQNNPISGELSMKDLNLAVLRPFFPNLQTLAGKVQLMGSVGGNLKKPLFYGNAKLQDGALAVVGVPLTLQNIQVESQIRGTNADLNGVFASGKGKGEIGGQIDWYQDLQAKLVVSGENLELNKPPLITSQISPEIEVIIRPSKKYINAQGVVLIPSAVIRPPEDAAEIVGESADVSVLDRRNTGDIDKILAVVEPWSINANIGVDLGQDIEFRGFGARLPLVGALHLTQSAQGAMQAKGVVQLAKRTKIDGIGQNLELNYAQIRFNGDMLNPHLSIEGEKQIEGQTIGVRILGTANAPQITVFNDAGLSEQQAMNALFTGRLSESSASQVTEQGFRTRVTNQLAAAGLSLGLSGTRNLTNQLGNALGLQSLTIDASGSSHDTNVNITGYITPDLYIRYGVGVFNAESSLSMRYQLTRRVYIEATSATERLIDVIYRWKF